MLFIAKSVYKYWYDWEEKIKLPFFIFAMKISSTQLFITCLTRSKSLNLKLFGVTFHQFQIIKVLVSKSWVPMNSDGLWSYLKFITPIRHTYNIWKQGSQSLVSKLCHTYQHSWNQEGKLNQQLKSYLKGKIYCLL